MSSILRLSSLTSIALAISLVTGCGGGDSGGLVGGPESGGKTSSGGSNSPDASSAGSGNGGKSTGSGGDGVGGGGGDEAGGATSAGGASSPDSGAGGTADTDSGAGGTASGGSSSGGSSSGGSSSGGSSSGGASSGGSSSGGAASGGTGSGGAPSTCGGLTCDPAATCAASKCVCPAGTTDKNGNGTKCTKANGGVCGANTDCTNSHCVGGTCCGVACTTPGVCEALANTKCIGGNTCQYGKQADGATCDDGNACTQNSCFAGKCEQDSATTCVPSSKCKNSACNPSTGACIETDVVCNDNNVCTTDTCSGTLGCQFTPNTASCSDSNACTTGDVCAGGACKPGTAKVCPNAYPDCANVACNPANAACVSTPKNNNGACDDGIDTCDLTGKCSAGVCNGQNDACGPIATSCAVCTSGGQCVSGHDCTCPATSSGQPVVETGGKCVLNNDECAADPCGPFATGCTDPTPSAAPAGDFVCSCGPGTTGNKTGSACVDKNECSGGPNPCGQGTCTNLDPPAKYSCACSAGFRSTPTSTGPVCTCDMSGTFAEVVTTNVAWSGIGGGIITDSPAGGVPTYGWSLRQQAIASDGTMSVVTVPCGGVAPTLCSSNAAYAQYQPVAGWGKTKMRSGFQPLTGVNVANVVPSGSYVEPQTSAILGLDLKDPTGPWPPCRQCINADLTNGCNCGNTHHDFKNTATWWANPEDANKLGVTTVAVRAGGDTIGDATLPDPPVNYPRNSECPRTSGGSDYAAWPGLVISLPPDIFTTYKWYGASRIQSGLASTSITFDAAASACVITGNVTGPDDGSKPGQKIAHSDARVAGCETGTNANPSHACTSPPPAGTLDEVGFYDGVAQSQSIVSSTFKLEKAPATINLATILAMAEGTAKETAITNACQAVRVKYCPAGKVCQ